MELGMGALPFLSATQLAVEKVGTLLCSLWGKGVVPGELGGVEEGKLWLGCRARRRICFFKKKGGKQTNKQNLYKAPISRGVSSFDRETKMLD